MSEAEELPRWWGKPWEARRYHVFEGETLADSLCGNWSLTRHDEEDVEPDADEYREGEDCKECARKAGVLEGEA